MTKRKFGLGLSLMLAAGTMLAACGSEEDTSTCATGGGEGTEEAVDISVAMVTDVGGVDDKSFNQGAWEGMQRWGEEHSKEQGLNGFSYFQSDTEADYITNLNLAAQNNIDIIFAIGYKLQPAVQETAEQYPDQYFGMVDSVVDLPNVASLNFADEEAAFLAGADPDIVNRDLFEVIEVGEFSSWTLYTQTMIPEQAKNYKLMELDVTKVWSHGDFPLKEIERLMV